MATRRRPSRGPSPLEANLADCLAEFDPVAERHGLTLHSQTVDGQGFAAEYWKEGVGIRLAYRIRDSFTVDICFPEGVRVSEQVVLPCIDLLDVAVAAGVPAPPPEYSLPDRQTAADLAWTLSRAAGPLLDGDRTVLPAAVERIRARLPSA